MERAREGKVTEREGKESEGKGDGERQLAGGACVTGFRGIDAPAVTS